jgi:hypothetical protein
MADNQSIIMPCISGRFCWVSRHEDWLPTFLELRNICSSVITGMIKIQGTNKKNSFKFLNGVAHLLTRAYVFDANHRAR